MKKLFLIITMATLLQGCLLTFATGAAIGGAIVYDKRSLSTVYQDQHISHLAQNALDKNKELNKKARVVVTSFNNTLLLVGEAPTEALKEQAGDAVTNAKIPHLHKVINLVNIGKPISTSTQANDAWITTEVKSKMLTAKGLKSGEIKVLTEDSIVYLLGKVSKTQANLASKVASQVSGVSKVVTLFDIQ